MSTTALTSSCHWKTLVPFCLRKKRPENGFKIIPFKTTLNWLFHDICCCLVIGSFNKKIDIFQQTVVRGLLYP